MKIIYIISKTKEVKLLHEQALHIKDKHLCSNLKEVLLYLTILKY